MTEAKLVRFVEDKGDYGGNIVSFTTLDYDSVFEEACKVVEVDIDSEEANWIELSFLDSEKRTYKFDCQKNFSSNLAWFKRELKIENVTILVENFYCPPLPLPPPAQPASMEYCFATTLFTLAIIGLIIIFLTGK